MITPNPKTFGTAESAYVYDVLLMITHYRAAGARVNAAIDDLMEAIYYEHCCLVHSGETATPEDMFAHYMQTVSWCAPKKRRKKEAKAILKKHLDMTSDPDADARAAYILKSMACMRDACKEHSND